MATKLSPKCKVFIGPGRYCLWEYIEYSAPIRAGFSFRIIDVPNGQGIYLRKAHYYEVHHVPGGLQQDDYCLVVLGDRLEGLTTVLVPRPLLTRI